jgi:hypothetical protein
MEANKNKIQDLINEKFNGNKSAFAKAIGVERSQISALINHGKCVGAKFYGGLIAYCEQNKLDFRDYIFLPSCVKNIDTNTA